VRARRTTPFPDRGRSGELGVCLLEQMAIRPDGRASGLLHTPDGSVSSKVNCVRKVPLRRVWGGFALIEQWLEESELGFSRVARPLAHHTRTYTRPLARSRASEAARSPGLRAGLRPSDSPEGSAPGKGVADFLPPHGVGGRGAVSAIRDRRQLDARPGLALDEGQCTAGPARGAARRPSQNGWT